MSKYFGTLALFQTFGHDVLNIVHVSIGGFVICVERCSTMQCLAGTAQYLLNCILRRIVADGNDIHVVFKAFFTRKERKLRGGQTIHFVFIFSKLKSYLFHTQN